MTSCDCPYISIEQTYRRMANGNAPAWKIKGLRKVIGEARRAEASQNKKPIARRKQNKNVYCRNM
jgi:hypothetical protein